MKGVLHMVQLAQTHRELTDFLAGAGGMVNVSLTQLVLIL